MSIWSRVFGALTGGWKTHGPNAIDGPGAWDSGSDSPFESVTSETALKLSAVYSCVHLRAETIGSLPIHLRDGNKNIVSDHPSYAVVHDSPNAMYTPAEFMSLQQAYVDMEGNGISIVNRRSNKTVISLDPVSTCDGNVKLEQKKSGLWEYVIGQTERYPAADILHLRGFSMNGGWGLPRIGIGREILSSQLSANDAAARAFRSGLKIGGFFEPTVANLTTEQQLEFKARLDTYGRPENAGKYMLLLKGLKPISGSDFRIKPAEAELLSSRHFGIEEICRLFNTPPQLIGHSDKASSWASSLEQINLFFLMYSLQPSFIRHEQRMNKTLLSPEDRAKGLQFKFSIQGLLRADMKTQSLMFASALQNGYMSVNEVRDLLDRISVANGDEYRVQLNMVQLGQETAPQPTA